MKKSLRQKYQQKTPAELSVELDKLSKQLAIKRIEKKIGKLKQVHQIKQIRQEIALIKTIMRLKQLTQIDDQGDKDGK